jgi:hypothetical protein
MVLAIPEALKHHEAFVALTTSLQAEHGDKVAEWEAMVNAWEQDHGKPNPYALIEETGEYHGGYLLNSMLTLYQLPV